MDRFESYVENRRNKPKPLLRISLLEDDTDALGLDGAPVQTTTVAKDRALSSIVNVIKIEDSDPKMRAMAQQRASWLRSLNSVAVKEEAAPAAAPEIAANVTVAAVTEAVKSVLEGTGWMGADQAQLPGVADVQKAPTRSMPRVASNLVPPLTSAAAPSAAVASSQLGTTKAVSSKEKELLEQERSEQASQNQRSEQASQNQRRKPSLAIEDSSDEDEAPHGAQKRYTDLLAHAPPRPCHAMPAHSVTFSGKLTLAMGTTQRARRCTPPRKRKVHCFLLTLPPVTLH